jgi:hypothetical protein
MKTKSKMLSVGVILISLLINSVQIASAQINNRFSTGTRPMVQIPNMIGVPVKWVRRHSNYFRGIHLIITGSSCSVSDTLSGAAVVVDQNPQPFQRRPYNAIVVLRTNC